MSSIISILTFRGRGQVIFNTYLRKRRLADHFAGLMVALHPLPPPHITLNASYDKNKKDTPNRFFIIYLRYPCFSPYKRIFSIVASL